MYREGPEGTPFHTLLVEGFVDGPVDVCKSHWSNQNFYRPPFIDKDYVIDFNLQSLISYFHHFRFMYLMADLPLQKMVRTIFNAICAFNFMYTSPNNTTLNTSIIFILINFCIRLEVISYYT